LLDHQQSGECELDARKRLVSFVGESETEEHKVIIAAGVGGDLYFLIEIIESGEDL
jgi:hypothetical protein